MIYILILKSCFCTFLAFGIVLFFVGLKSAISEHDYSYLFLSFLGFIASGLISAILNFKISC